MTDKEAQAAAYMRGKQWAQAAKLLDVLVSGCVARDRSVALLWKRSQCLLELQKLEAAVKDCRHVVKLTTEKDDIGVGLSARHMLLTTLLKINKYNEALHACEEWLSSAFKPPENSEADTALRRLLSMLHAPGGTRKVARNVVSVIEETLQSWVDSCVQIDTANKNNVNNGSEKGSVNSNSIQQLDSKSKEERVGVPQDLSPSSVGKQPCVYVCTFCSLEFKDAPSLRAHCQSNQHQAAIMSDEECAWKWRLPPRGFTAETYTLCESFIVNNYCRYGAQCVEAHGNDELAEWRERFEYRKKKLERATEIDNKGKSFTEQILEKWLQANSPGTVMKEKIMDVEDSCSNALVTTVSSKSSEREWTFTLHTALSLRAVALLQDAHRNHFYIKEVILGDSEQKKLVKNKIKEIGEMLTSNQEWMCPIDSKALVPTAQTPPVEHKVKIGFNTEIYGTFRQSVVFDLGVEPVLVKHLCVDVLPVEEVDKIKELCKEMTISVEERWDLTTANIIPFSSSVYPNLATPHAPGEGTKEQLLLNTYPTPKSDTFTLSQSTVTEKHLTVENYRTRMHELLYIEELARLEQVARYNITCLLRVAPSYLLAPSGMAASTAKYAHSGELFALLTLRKDVSEDTSAGRLILNNCSTVLIGAPGAGSHGVPTVYEALIEDKGKNIVYLRLPSSAVAGLGIVADTDYHAEVQFQLNRLTFCEWHHAVDRIADLQLIFPPLLPEPHVPWSPERQWSDALDPKMNTKQKEAVVAITTPIDRPLPPILLIGPYGTGKTYTLAQAIKQLLHQPETRILICTHSNSAADLYIKDYLHPWHEAGFKEAKPLRIYYHKRWVATVNQIVQKYCLIDTANGVRTFRLPTVEDIIASRIVVVTLSISMSLATLGLPKGFFTHILLDEAAQALESEALMPLALASPEARVVLAGDHMQLSPEIFSKFASERNLHISLLERLYDYYPPTFPCKILLCENYRAHQAIVDFTSELFYEQKLVASGRQPKHEKFYPLTFFTTRGEDIQDNNSTAFYNNSEVYELVERICELKRQWPVTWGKMDENSIGVMTPYADQVFRIRSELRKRRMGGISVERVLNVQGKEFRAVFLSTVRTRRTCTQASADYGFLSDHKLLNTAITRARSLVAVVGDPVALCSVGRCRKLWERFIQICNENQSLFGVTWSLLRSQLDGVELKKTFVLNPLAPEFIPRAARAELFQQSTFPISTQPVPLYYFPTLTTIVPNPATKLTSFVTPPRRQQAPETFSLRPPFLGPFSSSCSTPNGMYAQVRPPQDISYPPPKVSPDPNYSLMRPATDEHFSLTRAPLDSSFTQLRSITSVSVSSPKLNHTDTFSSPLVKPESGSFIPMRTHTDISTAIIRSIPDLTYHATNGDITTSYASHSQRTGLDDQLVLLKSNMMHIPPPTPRAAPALAPDRLGLLRPAAADVQLAALNTAIDLQRINYHNFNAIDPRVQCDLPNDIIPMPHPKILPTTSNHFSAESPSNIQHLRVARSEPERDNIQFLQNVHFPEHILLPVKVQEGNKNFAPSINQMFSEESHEYGWSENRGGGSVPLYARGLRRAAPPPLAEPLPPPPPQPSDPHHLYFQYFR